MNPTKVRILEPIVLDLNELFNIPAILTKKTLGAIKLIKLPVVHPINPNIYKNIIN